MWIPIAAAAATADATKHTAQALQHAQGTFTAALHGDSGAISDLVQRYLLPILWAVIVIVVAWFVASLAKRFIQRSLTRAKVEQTLSRFAAKLVFYTLMALGVMFALSKFGINVTSFAALLAAVGFAIGMAMTGSLSNIAAGFMLLLFQPFKVGQYVHAAGVAGTVTEIELFCTTLDTPDNRRIIIPNSKIFGGIIENDSHHKERRLDVSIRVSYAADLNQTRATLERVAAGIRETVQGEGRGSQVVLADLGESFVTWTVRVWLKAGDYWAVKETLSQAMKMHLDEAGIAIALPRMTVEMASGEDR